MRDEIITSSKPAGKASYTPVWDDGARGFNR
jgi:hypothetical protein